LEPPTNLHSTEEKDGDARDDQCSQNCEEPSWYAHNHCRQGERRCSVTRRPQWPNGTPGAIGAFTAAAWWLAASRLSLIIWNGRMLAAHPRPADTLSHCLPAWWKVRNLENCRIEFNDMLQTSEHGVSHRSVRSADELPTVVVCIVRYQQYRL